MIVGESNGDYHANKSVSSSNLKTLLTKGPYAYEQTHVLRRFEFKQTAAMKRGADFEAAVCGRVDLAVVPKGMKLNTKEGIAFKKESVGKLVVSNQDRLLFTEGVANVRRVLDKHHLWGVEQPTFRRPYLGVPGIQARPDWFVEKTGFSVDLKTTESLSKFRYKIEDYMYHMQAAFVREASENGKTRHPLVVIEKSYPFPCRVVWLDESYVKNGLDLMKRGLDKLAAHIRTETWPLLEQDSITVSPPERERSYVHLGRQDETGISSSDIPF